MADDAASPLQNFEARAEAVVGGNRFQVIETGAARLQALLDLIAGARESVRLLFYMFNEDWAGRRVRDALVEAARRGVDVKLLVDGFGSSAPAKFFDGLGEEGGEYCVFNPRYGRRYLMRNHQKLAIADDRTLTATLRSSRVSRAL